MRFLSGLMLALTTVWLGLATPVKAAEEFTRSLNLSYTVLNTGQTQVRYEIRLKNNFSTVYAKQYALTVNSIGLKGVEAKDADGRPLPVDQSERDNQTAIVVQLDGSGKTLGRDKEVIFTIGYQSDDAAEAYGDVLEVAIPKLAEPDGYSQYNVSITVPAVFGPPSIVEPARYTYDTVNGSGVLRFTNVGQASGISAIFGQEQSYDVQLTYNVENNSQNVGVVQVALPPDNAYQRVVYRSISPKPERISLDPDGNWIGEFRIAGQAQQSIEADLQITVLANPRPVLPVANPLKPGKSLFGSGEINYLKATSYWSVNHPAVQELAKQYQTPQAIYQYVVDALQYNYRRFEQPDATTRMGAAAALQDPANAVCLEFADVFVAVARAAGIPARRATGYAIAQNSRLRPLSLVADVLHAWPEYYDSARNLWVAIDPTWGDTTGGVDYFTKLDLRHLTFAVQGQDDERPYPAGMYKLSGQGQKNVAVELASQKLAPASELSITRRPGVLPSWGVPTREVIMISNLTGQARYNTEVAVGVEGQVELLSPTKVTIPILLPYETYEMAVELSGQSWLKPESAQLNIFIGNQDEQYEVSAARSFYHPAFRYAFMAGIVAAISAAAGGVLVFVIRRFRPVRRKG